MKYILPTFLLMVSTSLLAQKGEEANLFDKGGAVYFISEGRAKYENGDLRGALLDFRSALEKEPNNAKAMYWTAEVYLTFGDLEKCIRYGKNCLTEMTEQKPQDFLYDCNVVLGEAHLRKNLADEALAYFNAALVGLNKTRAKELNVEMLIKNCQNMMSWENNDSIDVEFAHSGFMSSFDDYYPLIADGGNTLYFVSRRQNTTGGGQNPFDNKYYEDIYVCRKDSITGEWGEPSNESLGRMNSDGFDAINWMNADGTQVLLTINDAILENPKYKTGSSDLFISKLNKKGTWGTPRSLGKGVNGSFFDAAGWLSEDGKTIYFISERNAAKSGTDIFKSTKMGKDWSKPEAVANVNSDMDESTVFLSQDQRYMFFSSKGHDGVGGYDIFVSLNLGSGKWSIPVNLGMPINSGEDDAFFKYYPEYGVALFASRREGGKGGFDILTLDTEQIKLPTEEEVIALEEERKAQQAAAEEAKKKKKEEENK